MFLGIMPFQAVLFQGGPAKSGMGITIVVGLVLRGIVRVRSKVHDRLIANDSKTDLPWKPWWYH
jgi:hypothetical protein